MTDNYKSTSEYRRKKDIIETALQPDDVTGATINLSSDTTFTDGAIIYIGTGGTLKVDLVGGGTGLEYKNIPNGFILPFSVSKIYSTTNGTTASDLISHVRN